MAHYRKIYSVQLPYLKDFIQDYWICGFQSSPNEANAHDSGPPAGYPIMHFLMNGAEFCYDSRAQSYHIAIMGQLDSHFTIFCQPGIEVLCVNFKPHGLYNLLGVPMKSLFNKIACGSTLFNQAGIDNLYKTLSQPFTPLQAIILIEKFLWENRKEKVRHRLYYDSLVDTIIEKDGILENVNSILPKHICLRTFQLYFNDVIGCSPKHFLQVHKHKHLLKTKFLNPSISLNYLADEGLYYDFSHFTKDFRRFTHCSPKDYFAKNNELAKQIVG